MSIVTRRAKIRQSMMALLVSYLRDGVTDTSKFTMVPGQTGTYPFTQNVWTFTLNGELYQITQQEIAFMASSSRHSRYAKDQIRLPIGVTIAFGSDTPDPSRSVAQMITTDILIVVRAPRLLIGESPGRLIALKIDQALYRTNSRVTIADYTVYPAVPVATDSYLSWTNESRGSWATYDSGGELEEMALDFQAKYAQPQDEW